MRENIDAMLDEVAARLAVLGETDILGEIADIAARHGVAFSASPYDALPEAACRRYGVFPDDFSAWIRDSMTDVIHQASPASEVLAERAEELDRILESAEAGAHQWDFESVVGRIRNDNNPGEFLRHLFRRPTTLETPGQFGAFMPLEDIVLKMRRFTPVHPLRLACALHDPEIPRGLRDGIVADVRRRTSGIIAHLRERERERDEADIRKIGEWETELRDFPGKP